VKQRRRVRSSSGFEERLARHAEGNGIGRVVHAGFDSPFAILLQEAHSDWIIGRYLRAYVDYVKTGKLSKPLVEDTMLDDDPKVPRNWQELSRRYLTRPGRSPDERRFMGDVIIVDGGTGTFISSEKLLDYRRAGRVSAKNFKEVFGFDPAKLGLAIVNSHTPNREQRLLTQVHETIHGRDAANGLSDQEFIENRDAFEVLTDLRAHLLARPILSEDFYEYKRDSDAYARRQGLPAPNLPASPKNLGVIDRFCSGAGNTPPPMAEVLDTLKKGIQADEGIRKLILHSPAFDHIEPVPEPKRVEQIGRALDRLIELERGSRLPPVVPGYS